MSPVTDPERPSDQVEIVIDTTSPVPAVEQIQQQVRHAVRLGHLPTGTRLLTIRRLAGHLGISNGVVARAYRSLEDEGVLRTAGRGGTTVAAAPSAADVDHARRHALARAAGDYAATASALAVTVDRALDAARGALTAEEPSFSGPRGDEPNEATVVLDEAVDGFRRRVEGIAGRWEEATPCEEWSVLDLVEHVITGNALAVHLLGGGSADTAPAPPRAPEAATAPQRLERSARRQREAFTHAGVLENVCDHPAGRVTGRELLRYRAVDIAVHTWDLARALDLDEALDPLLVETALSHYLPWIASMPSSPQFNTPNDAPPPGASAQHRLLHALGRQPAH